MKRRAKPLRKLSGPNVLIIEPRKSKSKARIRNKPRPARKAAAKKPVAKRKPAKARRAK